MARAVEGAQSRILAEARRDPEKKGMGTTLTVLALERDRRRFVIGHVGDSRAYRLRDGDFEPLTRDQTVVQEQVDQGRLTREQAREHPWGHILKQALGEEEKIRPDIVQGEVREGDLYLLSSDGLSAMLSEDEIGELLPRDANQSLDASARALVEAANARGGMDNVTVGLLRVGEQAADAEGGA